MTYCTTVIVAKLRILHGAAALSFKRPLLSADVSVCLCVGNFDAKYLGTKWFSGSSPIGAYRKLPTARRLLTSLMTSNDSVTSYSRRHNIQSRRIRKLGTGSTIRVDCGPLSALSQNIVFKTFCLELWENKHLA